MINLQGLQYPSLQELSRFLPGPGLALPGLQEKQVSLSSQNLKVKSGALIWYICTLLYLTYILWDQSWGRKKLKACHNSNRFTIWRSQEGKVVAKVCPVQWWPLLPKFTLRCRVNASLPHCHICTSLHLISSLGEPEAEATLGNSFAPSFPVENTSLTQHTHLCSSFPPLHCILEKMVFVF